jgi:hypothetical protein
MAQRFKAKTLLSNSGVFFNEVVAPNLVYNTGNQKISGFKNFPDGITSITEDGYPASTTLGFGGITIFNGDGNNTVLDNGSLRCQTEAFTIKTEDYDPLVLGTNNQNRLTITPDGNIGIGTELPSEALEVNGNIQAVSGVYALNLVYNTGNQNISGVKTFSDGLISNRGITGTNLIYNTGNQTISGVKAFASRPTVNQTGVLLSGELAAEFKFTGDLDVSLIGTKTFGRYSNGQRIPASGKTVPQVFELILTEPIPPTVSLTSSTVIPYNQISINNILNASNVINSLNSSVQTGVIEFRRGEVGSYTKLTGNQSSSFIYTHSLTDTAFNISGFNYRYIVSGTKGESNTQTLTITPSFFYRNYLGYSPNETLTFSQLEALSNSVLSDSKARTVSAVNPGVGNYVYYCYRASEGNLTSVSDGLEQFIGAFTKLTDVAGVNNIGVSVTYAVYKSNSTNAFTNATLIFN